MRKVTSNIKSLPLIGISLLLVLSALLNVGFSTRPTHQQNQAVDLSLPETSDSQQHKAFFLGAGDDGDEEESDSNEDTTEPVDVIRNGGFEERDSDPMNGAALEWTAYGNGQAHIGWYDETWPEAVKSGEHAQLMEIFQVEGNILDRVVAVHQTVNVVPNSAYDLTIHAIMRSDAPEPLRNQDEYEMNWGIDPSGQGNYDNVETWNHMPLTEQLRVGSHGDIPDNQPLFYEVITGTVNTGSSSSLTLFIRGVKKFPNGTEVNFDIDDVSLVGPKGPVVIIRPESDNNLPNTGVNLPPNLSIGALVLGGLVIVLLGGAATANLLLHRDDS